MTGRALASEHRSAEESTGLLLWQVTNRWQAAQRAALAPFRLTHVQFVLLASLAWLQSEQPVTQRQLADHAATDPMMTSQVLRALQRKGLIERAPHPTDRRAQSLEVTAAGSRLANKAVHAVEACDRAFFNSLDEDVAPFKRMLRQLTDSDGR
jgi:DNA-binding MarR family transcriptional regulator